MKSTKFSVRLQVLRHGKKLSQQQLADELNKFSNGEFNISKSMISRWENGKTDPQMDYVRLLKNYFKVPANYFIEDKIEHSFENEANKDIYKYSIVNGVSKKESDHIVIMRQLEPFRQKNVYAYTKNQLDEQNGISEMSKKYIVNNRCTAAGTPIDGNYEDAQQEIVVRNEVPRGADEVVTIAGDSMQPLLMRGSQAFVHYQPVPDYDGQIVIVSIKDIGVTCKKIYREDGKIRLKSINEKYDDLIYPAQDVRVIGKIITQKNKP